MKDLYLDYGRIIRERSPLIYNWAQSQNLEFFDFDNCFYSPERSYLVQPHIESVAKETNKLIIVEQHPFFDDDQQYVKLKNDLLEYADKSKLQVYFLTADYRYWNNNSSNECFFPHWYYELRHYALQKKYQKFNWSSNRKYNFSCNNMTNYRSEKIINYIECFRRNRSDWILSIYDHLNAEISKFDIRQTENITPDQIDIWNNQIKSSIKPYEYDLLSDEQLHAMTAMFRGHVDAYCNLVVEHSMEIEILSEKSFKPFLAKQIPVYLAHVGACEMLTKLGFDLFYDFVDHAQYDTIGYGARGSRSKTWTNRIYKVHDMIDHLYTTNFTDFINDYSTKTRLEKNHDHFYSQTIDKMCLMRLEKLVNGL